MYDWNEPRNSLWKTHSVMTDDMLGFHSNGRKWRMDLNQQSYATFQFRNEYQRAQSNVKTIINQSTYHWKMKLYTSICLSSKIDCNSGPITSSSTLRSSLNSIEIKVDFQQNWISSAIEITHHFSCLICKFSQVEVLEALCFQSNSLSMHQEQTSLELFPFQLMMFILNQSAYWKITMKRKED
jgi:hypothetical protein